MSTEEIAREQRYVSMLYQRLDELRERASSRLAQVLRETGGTRQARLERDITAGSQTERIAQLDAAEHGLCFGRIDLEEGGERRYIGRLGIRDEDDDYRPLLLDWRAPAARAFYLATAFDPAGVRLRRHITTRRRKVVGISDEVFDFTATGPSQPTDVAGEAALLAALNASRTGRMRDIVETIQAEQDRIITSELPGVLVVDGGPGTGKTAVALHRAAYLLYTHREQLARRGVLIVGPNTTFLRYISQVLPGLGETGVLLATVADLYPGVTARRPESPAATEIKGRRAMVDVLAAAIRDRQRVPEETWEIVTENNDVVTLDPQACDRAREKAHRSGMLHNNARSVFRNELLGELARGLAERIGADPFADDPLGGDDAPGSGSLLLDDDAIRDLRVMLGQDARVRAALDELWPALSPQRLLDDLFASREAIASAAPNFSAAERDSLVRAPGEDWTAADVPLLDEAAELLGEDEEATRAAKAAQQRAHRARVAYAQGVLDISVGSGSTDADDEAGLEALVATDLLDAQRLAERHETTESATTAERAATDRTWAFGHVIVDEAQELSEMAWRTLMRRCPMRSMTLVGDIAQTGDPAGAPSWRHVLEPHVGDRWRRRGLTVNYRTPAEVMEVAADVLGELDPGLEPPRSVREVGERPWYRELDAGELPDRLADLVAREASDVGDGRLAVIVPEDRASELGEAVRAVLPDTELGSDPDLERRTVVLGVKQCKGLEFDSVIVVDPERIIASSAHGLGDLYVALTRTTKRLGVVSAGPLPPVLAGLRSGRAEPG